MMPDIIEVPAEDNRPPFFKHCPVCKADTPPGAILCPKCGVNLEIARSSLIKDMALEVGKYGFAVGQEVQKPVVSPKKKITFFSVVSFIGACFICLVIYGFVKDVFLAPLSPPIRYTPTPTRRAASVYSTYTRVPRPTPSPCLLWSDITPKMKGKTVCVYGIISNIHANYQAGQSFIYFGTEDQFFVTNEFKWDDLKGCVQVSGTVGLNTYSVPYINSSDLYDCDPWMQQ